ncbi:MAG: undecaprenyl diphosphate synthase family protein [Halobacteria archaeon]
MYDWLLERKITDGNTPNYVVVVITETDLLMEGGGETLEKFLDWSAEWNIERVNVHISLLDTVSENQESIVEEVSERLSNLKYSFTETTGNEPRFESDEHRFQICIGIEGRNEFVNALQKIGDKVKDGDISAEDIDESDVEDHLVLDGEPDVIIKTGGEHLTNFMIWQSVYSELYFADFNWQNLRRRDFLRCIRDFQERERRFGE